MTNKIYFKKYDGHDIFQVFKTMINKKKPKYGFLIKKYKQLINNS